MEPKCYYTVAELKEILNGHSDDTRIVKHPLYPHLFSMRKGNDNSEVGLLRIPDIED